MFRSIRYPAVREEPGLVHILTNVIPLLSLTSFHLPFEDLRRENGHLADDFVYICDTEENLTVCLPPHLREILRSFF